MSGVLNSVDQRTNLVGENRLELLLFSLNSRQLFAINVFKVREVIKVPPLTKMPGAHHNVTGIQYPSHHGHAVDIDHRLAADLGVIDQGVRLGAIAGQHNGCHLVLFWIQLHVL